MPPETVSAEHLRRTCGRFLTGITIATAFGADGLPHGITVNSFTSVSLDPPLVLICVDCRAQFMTHCADGQNFGINILGESQQELSRRFARKEGERFLGVEWHFGKTGVPLLPRVLATMECELTTMIIEGDHFVLIGRVLVANCHEGSPLAYFRGAYRTLALEELGTTADKVHGELDWSVIIE
jgi:flavin-dependent trigonelline monooxygenase, reductase component